MSNPFPGVDPFIEDQDYWPDFHHTFITFWRSALNERLPADYFARVDERFEIVETHEHLARQRLPDVSVLHDPSAPRPSPPPTESSVATVEPVRRRLVIEAEHREAFIQIFRQSDERLVAVLELLSPTNKQGGGYLSYLRKRNELLLQDVHLVELDLLGRGERVPLEPDLPPGDYFAFVSRADRRDWCDVYAWRLPSPIPSIPIPLLGNDRDLKLDLQAIYNTAHQVGGFSRQRHRLYAHSLGLPVDAATRAWADQIARESQSRGEAPQT